MNKIVIEFEAEDRARLDRLTTVLERLTNNMPSYVNKGAEPNKMADLKEHADSVEVITEPEAPAEAPTVPQDTPKETPQETDTPTVKSAPEAPTENTAPTVTLEQIQQKVIQLATANGGAKKAQVRAVISAYGAKVTDLKEQPNKWDEVWQKLTALESEG